MNKPKQTFTLSHHTMCNSFFSQCISGHRAQEAVEMLKTFYKQENPNGEDVEEPA